VEIRAIGSIGNSELEEQLIDNCTSTLTNPPFNLRVHAIALMEARAGSGPQETYTRIPKASVITLVSPIRMSSFVYPFPTY